MAVGTATALMVAGGAFSAVSQYAAGQQQAKSIQRQAEFNAQIYEQQGQMIEQKRRVQEYQFNRNAANARGSIISQTAGKGFRISGSPLAVLIDNESQLKFDKAIEDYNLDVEANLARSGAAATRQQGEQQSRLARFRGRAGAFSTILNTGVTFGMLNMGNPLALKRPGGFF